MQGNRSFPRWSLLFTTIGLGLLLAPSARADEGMNLLLFEPAPGTLNYFSTSSSHILEHLQVGGALVFDYSAAPLRLIRGDTREELSRIVEHQAVLHATVGIGLFDRLELAFGLPVVLNQSSDDLSLLGRQNETISPSGTGNLRLIPKVRLLGGGDRGLRAALHFTASFPTGEAEDFLADAQPTYEPAVAVGYRFAEHGSASAQLGYRLRQPGTFLGIDLGDQLTGGAGLEVPLGNDSLSVVGDVFGAVTTEGERKQSEGESPVQLLGGLRWYGPVRLVFTLAGGSGLNSGFGNPRYRVLAMVGIDTPPRSLDPDGDHITGDDDHCPNEAEDFDNYQDLDGCPDLDHDEDGVVDTEDSCLGQPEDRDGFKDDDGCPDVDNDEDKIADKKDRCPNEAEDMDGYEDEDGCPELDNDEDGVFDVDDRCPLEAEDMDGYEDEDGCADPFHDRDRDGIADAEDKCPDEPETINGNKDEDGCPDKGIMKVLVTTDEIKILDKVFFDTGKATIKKVSFSLLNQVAQTIRANPQIRRIEVAGHTDDVGNDDANLKLSHERAESVANYLLSKGILPERVQQQGYGENKPLVDIRQWLGDPKLLRKHRKEVEGARSQNRRVEFRIVDQKRQIEKTIELDEGGSTSPAPEDDDGLKQPAPPPAPASEEQGAPAGGRAEPSGPEVEGDAAAAVVEERAEPAETKTVQEDEQPTGGKVPVLQEDDAEADAELSEE